MLFMMLAREALLPNGEEEKLLQDSTYIKQRISNCDKLADYSEDTIDLLKRMLEWDPKKRITAMQILAHPFIAPRVCELLCDSHSSRTTQQFDWKFDKNLPWKMERYAKSTILRQVGLRCLVHLAAASTLPPDLENELLTARHIFRSLNSTGSGQVPENQLRLRLKQEHIPIPDNFCETFEGCRRSIWGEEAALDYDVLVACILIDATWPDRLLREVFNILDRSRHGIIELEDLAKMANADNSKEVEAMMREVDFEGSGYMNYDRFVQVMELDQPSFQWFVPSNQE